MVHEYMNLRKLGGCKPLSPRERFENSYIPEPNSGCWLWLGTRRGSKGYGCIRVNNEMIPAHRYSWELVNSKIPEGLFVCHRCDNPSCVNPKHLFLGTHKQNMEDMVRKHRQSRSKHKRARGENNGVSKLRGADIQKIISDERPQRIIAKDYSITQATVSQIKLRKTWRHLNG